METPWPVDVARATILSAVARPVASVTRESAPNAAGSVLGGADGAAKRVPAAWPSTSCSPAWARMLPASQPWSFDTSRLESGLALPTAG